MKAGKFITFKFTFFRVIFLINTMLFLAVTLVPFLSSGSWWFIAILGLIFPFLLILEIIFLIVWGIKRSKFFFISFISLLLGWQQISVLIATNFLKVEKKSIINIQKKVRVMSWNVSTWDAGAANSEFKEIQLNLMLDVISAQDPDILCLQEFFESHDPTIFSSAIKEIKNRGYKFSFFFPSSSIFDGKLEFGLAIFSKFPIIKSDSFFENSIGHAEGFIYVDINIDTSIVRVFNFHTESPGFSKEDYSKNGGVKISGGTIGKIKRSYFFRKNQVVFMKYQIKNSPYPVIVCGDLGDIPNSFSYFHLKKDLADVFLQKGKGFGRTYKFLSPTLRVDYIFISRKLKVLSYDRPLSPYSDHFPIISEIGY